MSTPNGLKPGSPPERIVYALTELLKGPWEEPPEILVAVLAKYPNHNTSGFKSALRVARKSGLVNKTTLSLSEECRSSMPMVPGPQSNADAMNRILAILKESKAPKNALDVLDILADGDYHSLMSLAKATNYLNHSTPGFKALIRKMKTYKILEEMPGSDNGGSIRLLNMVFPFGRPSNRSGASASLAIDVDEGFNFFTGHAQQATDSKNDESTRTETAKAVPIKKVSATADTHQAIVSKKTGSASTKTTKTVPIKKTTQSKVKLARTSGGGNGSSSVDRICKALMELRSIGLEQPPRAQVAILAQYPGAKNPGFEKALYLARKDGVIESLGEAVKMSAEGLSRYPKVASPVSNKDMITRLIQMALLKKAPKAATITLLNLLSDGQSHSLNEIAEVTGYPGTHTCGFKKFWSSIGSLFDFIVRPTKGADGPIFLADTAFPCGRPIKNNTSTSMVASSGSNSNDHAMEVESESDFSGCYEV